MSTDKKMSLLSRKLAAGSTLLSMNSQKSSSQATSIHQQAIAIPNQQPGSSNYPKRADQHHLSQGLTPSNEYFNQISSNDISPIQINESRPETPQYFDCNTEPNQSDVLIDVPQCNSGFQNSQCFRNRVLQPPIQSAVALDSQSFCNQNAELQNQRYFPSQTMKNTKANATKALLKNLSHADLLSKIGESKTRSNSLYQKLQTAIVGKTVSEPSPQVAVNSTKVPKSGTLYSSLVKIEQKISSKLEKLIEKTDRKRVKRFWTSARDAQLQNYFKMYGPDWNAIANVFNDTEITADCVKERYDNHISPQISKARFSLQEDQTIAHYYAILGGDWKRIAAHLPGRTETMIRNRFYTSIKKKHLENFLNHPIQEVSVHSSENKLMTQPSGGGNSSLYDDMSEKFTGKFSEPEINSGSTGASLLSMKKPANMKKISKRSMHTPCVTQHPNMSQYNIESSLGESNQMINNDFIPNKAVESRFEPIESFLNTNHHLEKKEPEYWDPVDCGYQLEMNQKELSLVNEKEYIDRQKDGYLDQEVDQQGFNSYSQDKFCESLLNFRDDKSCLREHPLTAIDQNSVFNSTNTDKLTSVVMDEEVNEQLQDPNLANQLSRPIPTQSPSNNQSSTGESNLASKSQLNQIETLISQIKSIEKLFERTKQEINFLQSRLAVK